MRIPCRGRKTWAFLFLIVIANATLVFSQPPNIYTFSGDVDLGVQFLLGFQSSGQHYIGVRGDTVYVITSNGWTWCSKSTDGGQTFGTPVRVNSTAEAYNPSMRVDTGGIIYVAYQDEFADIRFTKSTDGGVTFIPGVKVNDDTIPQVGQEKPAIAVNNKGQIFIAWNDQRNIARPGRTVFSAASFDGGLIFTPNVQVSEPDISAGVSDIAADDSGRVYVLYGGVAIARSIDTGQSFPSRTYITEPLWLLGFTSMAVSGPFAGIVGVAAPPDDVFKTSICFSASCDYGQTFSPIVLVNDDSLSGNSYPSLFFNNGAFFVSWNGERSGRFRDIYFSYSSDTGQTFAHSKQANSDTLTDAVSPSLAINEAGKAFVVWLDPRRDPWYEEDWHPFVAVGNPTYIKGDLNLDLILSIADVVTLINVVFLNSSFPAPFENADGNCDGILRPVDVVLELQAVFLEQDFPC
ncbi:MAG TPA: sialidase family protein [Verrucomicrobiae bacterium]|nr:sialidase family protein [Verrucomicrobiae bacterium]